MQPQIWAICPGLDTAVLMMDRLDVAGEMIVVALVITPEETKVRRGKRGQRPEAVPIP
jgi:hypothetical protein